MLEEPQWVGKPIVDTISCLYLWCRVTNVVFQWSTDRILCWKKPFIISIDEKMIAPPSDPNIWSCHGNGYVSGYSLVLTFCRSTITLGFPFFQTTKAGDEAADDCPKETFSTQPWVTKELSILLITFWSLLVRLYTDCFSLLRFFLSLNGIGILILSLNISNSIWKSLAYLHSSS